MRIRIRCRSRSSIHRLVLPFPLRITVYRGHVVMVHKGFPRKLREGNQIYIPAMKSIDLELAGSLFSPAECQLELYDHGTSITDFSRTHSRRPRGASATRLCDLISCDVFRHPHRCWSAGEIATALSTTPITVRRALFSKGEALSQLCRTQRLMRALFEVIQGDLPVPDLKERIGWADGHDLEAAFCDWFGLSMQSAARLRSDSM